MQITIMDLICTDFIAVIFSIMGLILFRSSQVAKHTHENFKEKDISFDQFLDSKWASNQPSNVLSTLSQEKDTSSLLMRNSNSRPISEEL